MASLRSKVLENIRFFGPYNIYSEKTDIFANEQEMQNHLKLLGLWKEPEDPNNLTGFEKPWQQVQDVPQDFISALIQYLFPSPDGAIFVANERRGDPLVDLIRDQSGVNLTRLNHLIETLLVFKKKFSPSTTSKDWEQLKTDIFNILMPPPKEGKKKEGRTKQERVEYFGQRKLEKQKNGIEH